MCNSDHLKNPPDFNFCFLIMSEGAKRTSHLLAAGGTAALVYGQANTVVSDATLLAQRRAVAAASVLEGAGELDITLVLADGADTGRVDPAFAAHEDPIGMWAEAVWGQWLPRPL